MTVTPWHIEARMRDLLTHAHPREAENEARHLLADLRKTAFVRPGQTMDDILDHFSAIVARAEGAVT